MAISVQSFPPKIAEEIFNKVNGHSSLARLSRNIPIAFSGTTQMVFSLDTEVDIVGENDPKSEGGATIATKTIYPIKFEYGARVSDEFMIASEEDKVNILAAFNEGFARKLGEGMDIAAMHGFNPRTGTASSVVNGNDFDDICTTNVVEYIAATPDANIESAISDLDGFGVQATGIAMAPGMRSDLAALTTQGGAKVYPEFGWGAAPEEVNGLRIDVNASVKSTTDDMAIIGDFRAFKWGYAKDIMFDVIEYGDPDNTGYDLKGHNQVYLRAEAYIGWAILDDKAFAIISDQVSE